MNPVIPNIMMENFLAVFGIDCSFRPKAGGVFSIRGIFENKYLGVEPSTGMPISTSSPQIGIKLAHLPAGVGIKRDDIFVVNGKSFSVREVRPDGLGAATVMLYE